MKCKRCESEKIVKNGLRRGKPCYLCKDCGHQFTSETAEQEKYNKYDKYIARYFYKNFVDTKKIHPFVNTKPQLIFISKLLNQDYLTVYHWAEKEANLKGIEPNEVVLYLRKHENGRDIYGLLFPQKAHFQPSEKLLNIIRHKK